MDNKTVALLAEGVGRNRLREHISPHSLRSPSSRRAWVEMQQPKLCGMQVSVALLAEGVGRNATTQIMRDASFAVALLAEGVGRNRRA